MSMKALPVLQPLCCGPDTPPLPEDARHELAARFKALADPTRVAIVNRLATADEVCVCDLNAAFRSQTQTSSAVASRFTIATRVGSASALKRAASSCRAS